MSFVLALHALLVLGLTVRILLRDDLSPPARPAWFVILLVLPYAGSAVYFLFGENDLGRAADRRHERIVADTDVSIDHVHVLYYIWLTDATGTNLAEASIRAAGRGVTCRAMAEGLGSHAPIHSALWRRMEAADVRLAVALPSGNAVPTVLTSRIDVRNALAADPVEDGFAAQVVGVGPTLRRWATPQLFSGLIGCAHSELTILTTYRKRQRGYVERSVEVTLLAVRAWSWYRRIWSIVVATVGPVLQDPQVIHRGPSNASRPVPHWRRVGDRLRSIATRTEV